MRRRSSRLTVALAVGGAAAAGVLALSGGGSSGNGELRSAKPPAALVYRIHVAAERERITTSSRHGTITLVTGRHTAVPSS